jgi:ketosteroid isomerase-like protein
MDKMELVRRIYEEWLEGRSVSHLVARDLEYVNPDYAVEAGTRHDRKALRAVREIYPDYEIVPERYVDVGGDDVLVLGTATGTGKSGVEMNVKQGFIWTVANGQAVRPRWFNDWDEALAAAGVED